MHQGQRPLEAGWDSHSPSAGTLRRPGNPCSTSSVSHSRCCRPWGSGVAIHVGAEDTAFPPGPAALTLEASASSCLHDVWEGAPTSSREVMSWSTVDLTLAPFHTASLGLCPGRRSQGRNEAENTLPRLTPTAPDSPTSHSGLPRLPSFQP